MAKTIGNLVLITSSPGELRRSLNPEVMRELALYLGCEKAIDFKLDNGDVVELRRSDIPQVTICWD